MNRRKSMIVIAMVALLLTFTVSGTIAWLAASTDEVVNVFTPGEVGTDIKEGFENNVKYSIQIENTGTVPVFVRVSVSGYYVKDVVENGGTKQEIVRPWNGLADDMINTTSWFKGSDGFYYYRNSVPKNEETEDLLADNKSIMHTYAEGEPYLVVNVIQQSIQADGTTLVNGVEMPVVTAKWGVYVVDGKLSLTAGN